jgi:hypothetical protein
VAKKLGFKASDVIRPPGDQPFVWHQAELLRSPPWRRRSINCVRLIEFLLVEQMAHGGLENGNLLAPFVQLEAWGIGRRLITDAVDEAEALGLIEVRRGGKKGLAANHLSAYRLTFYATRCKPEGLAKPYWVAPTDEWKRLKTVDEVDAAMASARSEREKLRRAKNRKQVHKGEPVRVHEGELVQCTKVNRKSVKAEENCQIGPVHEGEPLYISRTVARREVADQRASEAARGQPSQPKPTTAGPKELAARAMREAAAAGQTDTEDFRGSPVPIGDVLARVVAQQKPAS